MYLYVLSPLSPLETPKRAQDNVAFNSLVEFLVFLFCF
jgi:hypothetical protein